MTENQKAYRQVFKVTSLFGGVQVISILAAMLRSKFAALFIGPAGVGILGVLNSTIHLITNVSKFGLDTSSIKEIAFANKLEDKREVSNVIYVLKRLLWITGLLGTVVTLILSPFLSQIAFQNKEFTFSFIWISIAVLFKQLTFGNMAILQGLRKLKKLAKVNLYSSICSVFIVVPLYYFFGLDGIVPTIILTTLLGYLISKYFTFSIEIESDHKSLKRLFFEGKPMIKLGVTLSIGSLITLLVAYLIQVYITNTGGLTEVGYYNAGIIIINSYVGLIFEAMSKDYYPRLSEIIDDTKSVQKAVTQQATIAVLLITPMIIFFLTFAESIIVILYSKAFLPILVFVNFAIMGILFKAVSWSLAFVIIAKGDSKTFIKTEIGSNILLLVMNGLGYFSYGLLGLGVSFVVHYFLYLIIIFLTMKFRYKFIFVSDFLKVYLICVLFAFTTFFITYIENTQLKYILLGVLVLVSSVFTLHNLNKRLDIKSFIKGKFDS
ncbi:oligosaccharide flippase family protein [Thalassobellus suaedae]|uniref:Oligosaccharide flippase family protein n=1 Tax=Thalassobellus suaedae TaxID=3074124 RepID=A0ABY9Y566_9FLAO|nr:oligosaccharide flippase family protein [Flavobacteriaceae bacterium HL-DH10]